MCHSDSDAQAIFQSETAHGRRFVEIDPSNVPHRGYHEHRRVYGMKNMEQRLSVGSSRMGSPKLQHGLPSSGFVRTCGVGF